jgi:hypothetical protein
VLPRQFGTPLFKYYLEEDGEEKIKGIAAQMPQQIKDKLLGQLTELKSFEQKVGVHHLGLDLIISFTYLAI